MNPSDVLDQLGAVWSPSFDDEAEMSSDAVGQAMAEFHAREAELDAIETGAYEAALDEWYAHMENGDGYPDGTRALDDEGN